MVHVTGSNRWKTKPISTDEEHKHRMTTAPEALGNENLWDLCANLSSHLHLHLHLAGQLYATRDGSKSAVKQLLAPLTFFRSKEDFVLLLHSSSDYRG